VCVPTSLVSKCVAASGGIWLGYPDFYWLAGFLRVDNLSTLLQRVSVFGILVLGRAVIGRGIDLSMVATLLVAPGLKLQKMANDGHLLWLEGLAAIGLADAAIGSSPFADT